MGYPLKEKVAFLLLIMQRKCVKVALESPLAMDMQAGYGHCTGMVRKM